VGKTPTLTQRQRDILDVFQSSDKPLTARQAWEMAGQDQMGLATVYRALKKLIEYGEIRPVKIKDAPPMYMAESNGHRHHFYCTKCHEVFEIHRCVSDLNALVPDGFELRDHSITLYGKCEICKKSK